MSSKNKLSAALTRLYHCKETLQRAKAVAKSGELTQEQKQSLEEYRQKFIQAMDDDLNTADAIAYPNCCATSRTVKKLLSDLDIF